MNGYKVQLEAFKTLLERSGEDGDTQEIKDKIRVYETLANYEKDDKYIVFDSGMFNDIFKGYVSLLMDQLKETYEADGETDKAKALETVGEDMTAAVYSILDVCNAKQAENRFLGCE